MTRALLLLAAALSLTLSARADRGEVVLNEVLVNEPGGTVKLEFVELHNGGGDLVDLSGWDFIDGGSSPDTTALPAGLEIEPFGFAIIADDTLTFVGQWSLPPGTPIVQIKMSLGNSGDSVAVVDDLDGVRKFRWSSGGDDGISIEKILPLGGDDPTNWTASLDPLGVTPGLRNSVTPSDIDAALFDELVTMTPGSPQPGDDVAVEARVVNLGAGIIDSAEVSFTIDAVDEFATVSILALAPGDTATVEATWFGATAGPHTLTVEVLAPEDEVPANDSVDRSFTVGQSDIAITEVMANPAGNEGDIPGGVADEFLELLNRGESVVDVTGWSLTDGDGVDAIIPWDDVTHGTLEASGVVTGTTLIPAGGYALVLDPDHASPSRGEPQPYSIPAGTIILTVEGSDIGGNGLAASNDPLTLYDAGGTGRDDVIDTFGTPSDEEDPADRDDDSLDAIPFDPGDGFSLERIDPDAADAESNWAESAEGGTPGAENSVTPSEIDVAVPLAGLVLDPSRPKPGDDVTLLAEIVNAGTQALAQVDVSFMLDEGAPFHSESLTNLAPGDTVQLSALSSSVSEGSHTFAVEATTAGDQNPANDRAERSVLVRDRAVLISELMANPAGNEGETPGGKADEYIELWNISDDAVDLAGWSFTDGDGVDELIAWDEAVHDTIEAPGVTTGSTVLGAGSFAVILDADYATPDRGAPQPYGLPAGALILTVGTSDLGGSGLTTADPITLYDAGGQSRDFVMDTFGTPIDDDDPSERDDDGLDEIPFDPGDGKSIELIDPAAGDTEANWSASPPGGTPGKQNSSTPFDIDAGIASSDLALLSAEPQQGESATIGITVHNVGLQAVGPVEVLLEERLGENLVPIDSTTTAILQPGLSETVEIVWADYPGGAPIVQATLRAADDQNPDNDTAERRFGLVVVINEVASNPVGLESEIPGGDSDEWAELYNASADTIDLDGWMLSDGDGVDTLRAWSPPLDDPTDPDLVTGTALLPPGAYALVLDEDYVDRDASQPLDPPPGTLAIGVSDGDFATSGLSTTEPLTLFFPDGTARADVASTFGAPIDTDDPFGRDASISGFPSDPGEGRSLERALPGAADVEASWQRSLATFTPGSVNSITPVARDLSCYELFADNPGAAPLADLGLTAVVAVAGTTSVSGASLELYLDADLDEILSPTELIGGPTEIAEISPGDTIEIVFEGGLDEGRHRLVAQVSADDRPTNDRATLDLAAGDVEAFLVVNEFMNRPDEDAGQPEWIEILNGSERDIDLAGWTLGDDEDRSPLLAGDDSPIRMAPGAFIVLTQDLDKMLVAFPLVDVPVIEPDRWETLNNTDDVITLADPQGFVVDRVPYDDAWRGKRDNEAGVSWERIDHQGNPASEANWWLSVDPSGSTPGRENSLAEGFSSGISLEVGPDPFSPDGNGFQDETAIRYRLPPKSVFTLRVFDSLGRPVRTLVDEVGSANGVLVWDGTDDAGRTLDVGIYILLAEAKGERLMQAKRTVVVARPLR